jgi:glycosyltransferase involved in cell wall biosynthesis
MLELIQDNRSGNRLEIAVFTFNEEQRIRNILQSYGDRFDIVLLDGGSSDRTLQIVIEAGATVFHRIGQEVGEKYFAYYVNHLTKSGLCFYLFADEYITPFDLDAVQSELRTGATMVLCSKAEWVYGRKMRTLNHLEPRGFRQGYAQYTETLHANLQVTPLPGVQASKRVFDLDHLHIWSVQSYFGKIGVYSHIEIKQFRQTKHPTWRFFRRYVASLIGFPLTKVWRERGIGVPRVLFWILFDFAELTIAALSWIEQACLMSPEEQLALYSRFYSKDLSSTERPQDKRP